MADSTEQNTGAPTTMAPAQDWAPNKKLTPRKRRRMVRIAILAAVAAAYLAGAWYFSSHFAPGTTVDGVEAGLMTTADLSKALTDRAAAYQQHITNEDGFDLTITGSDVDMTCAADKVAQEALDRTSPILWPGYVLSPQHMLIDAQVSADEEALTQAISTAVAAYNEQATAPTNANGAYNEESGTFEVVKEAVGTALDPTKIYEESTVAARELRSDIVLDEDALAQPAITEENETLLASIEQANKIIAQDIEVTCDDETVATIDKKTMASWISFTDEQAIDIFGAYAWVEGNEAIKAAGNATDEEHVWALDVQKTCDDIHRVMERELGDKAHVIRTAIETKPVATPGAKERGRHIDINLTTQFVRFYDENGNVVWDSYCVSGGWDSEYQEMHATPTGTFAIQAKQTNTTLVGADRNGDQQPDYESFVYYWMPFLNYDYGLHDATWRSEFGGDIRYWWGSHGCVNLPYDKAEQLFNLVNVGDTVYIHE